MIRITNLCAPLDAAPDDVLALALRKTQISPSAVVSWRLIKRSIDARDKARVHFVHALDIELFGDEAATVARSPHRQISIEQPPVPLDFSIFQRPEPSSLPRPIVVGAGPAGLFAALALAEAGRRPIVLERGRSVRERQADVRRFFATGELDPESNVQFGEGGAGTFSDGKLNTGIKRDRLTQKVFDALVAAGAPREILWEAKPHIGTDRLAVVVENLRAEICAKGGEFLFQHRFVGMELAGGALRAIEVIDHRKNALCRFDTRHLFLCVGHSARDTFEMLLESGVTLTPKPFSIGVRIEHPQAMIDESQYGRRFAGHPALGAADYKLAVHLPNGRSAYTFCMCPGGLVVAAASEQGGVVTNGMSELARDQPNANAALLVGLTPADFGDAHPLAGVAFQRVFERAAFELGGAGFRAPAQTVGDFLKSRASTSISSLRSSYAPGVRPTDLTRCLPKFASDALRQALPLLDKRLRGFAHPDAVMTGIETRSSSPVRIERDATTLQSVNVRGLFPCGEGAGYAGGITSSAADGLRAALAFLASIQPTHALPL
ncbi:MAG: FAD-binding protein [Myxococcales bacterium]|jgi:uncharacterized FAD-dependent dehydrogenase|nr:FAD-binding protein [Myxococcales bacterium]